MHAQRSIPVATMTAQLGFRPLYLHLMFMNFSKPMSAPKPACSTCSHVDAQQAVIYNIQTCGQIQSHCTTCITKIELGPPSELLAAVFSKCLTRQNSASLFDITPHTVCATLERHNECRIQTAQALAQHDAESCIVLHHSKRTGNSTLRKHSQQLYVVQTMHL